MGEYIRKTWKDGEVITAEKMNNLEAGISEAKKAAELLSLALSSFVVIGTTEPQKGPALWFDTSPRTPDKPAVSDEYILMLEIGGEDDEAYVDVNINGEDYPVTNLSEPEATETGDYQITVQ